MRDPYFDNCSPIRNGMLNDTRYLNTSTAIIWPFLSRITLFLVPHNATILHSRRGHWYWRRYVPRCRRRHRRTWHEEFFVFYWFFSKHLCIAIHFIGWGGLHPGEPSTALGHRFFPGGGSVTSVPLTRLVPWHTFLDTSPIGPSVPSGLYLGAPLS